MEHRGKVRFSTLLCGNRAVGARGLAKGEFITKSWCFSPAIFVTPSVSRTSLSSLSPSLLSPATRPRLPQYLQSHIFSNLDRLLHPRRRWAAAGKACPPHAVTLSSPSRSLLPSLFCLLDPWGFRCVRYIHVYVRPACTLRVFIFVFTSRKRRNYRGEIKRRAGHGLEEGQRGFYEGGHYGSPRRPPEIFALDKIEYQTSLKISAYDLTYGIPGILIIALYSAVLLIIGFINLYCLPR